MLVCSNTLPTGVEVGLTDFNQNINGVLLYEWTDEHITATVKRMLHCLL
jgi:hypothetical protein